MKCTLHSLNTEDTRHTGPVLGATGRECVHGSPCVVFSHVPALIKSVIGNHKECSGAVNCSIIVHGVFFAKPHLPVGESAEQIGKAQGEAESFERKGHGGRKRSQGLGGRKSERDEKALKRGVSREHGRVGVLCGGIMEGLGVLCYALPGGSWKGWECCASRGVYEEGVWRVYEEGCRKSVVYGM